MEYNFKEIGERIQKERNKLGISQDEFIYKLNCAYYGNRKNDDNYEWERTPQTPGIIGRNTLSDIENGKVVSFDLRVLSAMAILFKCEIGYLLCEKGYENKTREITDVITATGLSSQAIDNILNCQFKTSLSMLMENPDFTQLVFEIFMSNEYFNKSLPDSSQVPQKYLTKSVRAEVRKMQMETIKEYPYSYPEYITNRAYALEKLANIIDNININYDGYIDSDPKTRTKKTPSLAQIYMHEL